GQQYATRIDGFQQDCLVLHSLEIDGKDYPIAAYRTYRVEVVAVKQRLKWRQNACGSCKWHRPTAEVKAEQVEPSEGADVWLAWDMPM
uniref:Fibronectin type-III domain-containing protein n=1 Tax=Macrostomum lignano TaxID=282301 RepID=A0A1I8F6Z9_9PLAT